MNTTAKTIRVSVPVSPEVLEKFQRFSEVSGLSVGKSMADWLRDTMSGLDAMTVILESHKAKPSQAISQLQTLANTLQLMTATTIENMKTAKLGEGDPLAGERLRAQQAMREASQISLIPPSSNTGGKGTKNNSTPSKPSKARTPKTQKNDLAAWLPKNPLPPALVQAYADTNGVPPRARK